MFEGIITPLLTPFNRDATQSINYDAVDKLIDYVIANGVDGVFALGSNGEFHVTSPTERIEFVKRVVEHTDHRVPVYAGPGACSTREAVYMAQAMEAEGADALSVISPYFVQVNERELTSYFEAVAHSVKIPIILYNIPRLTGINISDKVFEHLAELDNVAGIKDSSRNLENLQSYIDVAKPRGLSVLVGSDGIIARGYRMGAHGAIAGMSNVIPKHMVELFAALRDGNDELADKMQEDVNIIRSVNGKATMPSVLKRSLELAGIAPMGPARLPVQEVSKEIDGSIRTMLKFYGLL